MKEISKEEAKAILDELSKKAPPIEFEEFLCGLHLALDIFFEGKAERDGKIFTLKFPNGKKFRITAELVE